MNISNFSQANTDLIAKAAGGMQAFIEYSASFREKILRFTSDGESNSEVLSIPVHWEEKNQDVVGYITKEQYQTAFNDETAIINVRLNDAGDVIPVSGDKILDAVESSAQDLALQSEYCKTAISNAEMTRQEFCSLISAKYSGFSMEKIANYVDLIENKDSVTSLKALFGTYKLGGLVQARDPALSDVYIKISDANAYTGESVWIIALTNIGNTISGFFDVVWLGIFRMGEFFESILNGLVKFGKWLLSKMFRQFTTNWELSNKTCGICDLPAVQVPIAKYTRNNDGGSIAFSYADWTQRNFNSNEIPFWYNTSRDQSYRRLIQDYNGALKFFGTPTANLLNGMLHRMIIDKLNDDDIYEYLSEIEILLPTNPGGIYKEMAEDNNVYINDWSLRLGADEAGNIWLRIFPILDPAYLASATDATIFNGLGVSWTCMCDHYFHAYPFFPGQKYGGYNDTPDPLAPIWFMSDYNPYKNFTTVDLDDPSPVDVVANTTFMFNAKNFLETVSPSAVSSGETFSTEGRQYAFMLGFVHLFILPYMAINSNGILGILDARTQSQNFEYAMSYISNNYSDVFIGTSVEETCHIDTSKEAITPWTETSLNDYISGFRPYAHSEMLPILAHYQTLAEQAQEIENAIVVVAIVAVAAFVAYKLHKLKVKRQNLAIIQQGALDSMSWELGSNPSETDLNNFRKLQKKVKRTNKLNGLLGIGSPTAVGTSTFSLVGGLSEQIKAMRNGSGDASSNATIQTVSNDIHNVLLKITG